MFTFVIGTNVNDARKQAMNQVLTPYASKKQNYSILNRITATHILVGIGAIVIGVLLKIFAIKIEFN